MVVTVGKLTFSVLEKNIRLTPNVALLLRMKN